MRQAGQPHNHPAVDSLQRGQTSATSGAASDAANVMATPAAVHPDIDWLFSAFQFADSTITENSPNDTVDTSTLTGPVDHTTAAEPPTGDAMAANSSDAAVIGADPHAGDAPTLSLVDDAEGRVASDANQRWLFDDESASVDIIAPAADQGRLFLDETSTFNFTAGSGGTLPAPNPSLNLDAYTVLSAFTDFGPASSRSDAVGGIDMAPFSANLPYAAVVNNVATPPVTSHSGSSGGGGTSTSGSTALTNGATAVSGLIINITYDSSVNNAPTAFKTDIAAVVQYFESHFTDPVTINIDIGYGEIAGQRLGGGALGESETYLDPYTYSQVKNALAADAKSAADATAVGTLPSSDPTNGGQYWVATAEEKALGLLGASSALDGYVGFSSTANTFDYNTSDGVTAAQYDFFAVVAHEFSEVMGRQIMVGENFYGATSYEPLDLFHYSAPGTRDFVGTQVGYFSINGGTTNLNNFNINPGGDFGDWAASAGNDSFSAFGNPGAVEPVTSADLQLMDVIGWDSAQSTTTPGVPSAPDLVVASDSGLSNTDNLTNVATPTFTGTMPTGNIGATITIYANGVAVGTGTDSANTYTITTSALSDGTYTITAVSSDAAGNHSAASNPLTIKIDTLSPAAPSTPDLNPGSDSGLSQTDNLTNDTTPTFSGMAEAGSTVKLFDTNGPTVIGTGVADGSSNWTITTSTLSTGAHTVTAEATDPAGNTGAVSDGIVITIDTSKPSAPSATDLVTASDSGDDTDNLTNDTTPTITGTAEADSMVTLYDSDGTTVIGTAVATGGTYSVTTSALADGIHSITATATNAAGNTSNASVALGVTIDTTATIAADPVSLNAVGKPLADLNGFEITGMTTGVEDGRTLTLEIREGTDTLLYSYTTLVAANAWLVAVTDVQAQALVEGTYSVHASVSDVAGNTASHDFTLTVDTLVPDAPSVPDLDALSDSGALNSDNYTSNTTPTFDGTAEVGSTVTLYDTDGTTVVGTAVADGNGHYSVAASLAEGAHIITATATDAAGNSSASSTGLGVMIDTTSPAPPSTPDMIAASDNGLSNIDNQTSMTTPTFTGTADDDSTVTIFADGIAVGAGTPSGGIYTITITTALALGLHTITAQATDLAGNLSVSDALSMKISPPGVIINGTANADTIDATHAIGGLFPTNGDDIINGLGGNDTISGLDGNDYINGGAGADTMRGGPGNDVYIVDNTSDKVIENLNEGMDSVYSSVTYTLPANVENLTLTGATAINGTGNSLANVITGNDANNIIAGLGGADTLDGGGGIDTATYAASTAGVNVSLMTGLGSGGDAAGDTLVNFENLTGSAYNDTLEGNTGNNVLVGGSGTDTVSYAHATAAVTVSLALTSAQNTVGAGTDTLTGFENLTGSAFDDTLTGNTGNNVLSGLDGNDTLNGGAGADTLIGGKGNDVYVVDNVGDVVNETGGDGIDTVQSSITFSLADAVHVKGDVENLTLTGSSAINGTGNALANVITGNDANNTIAGLGGADTLDGGGGIDTATYAASSAGVNVSLMTGLGSGGDAEGDTLINFENLTGSNFDDTLEGNVGNNILKGGLGINTVSYEHASAGVTVNLALTSAQNTVSTGTDTLTGFQNLTGSGFADTLLGTSGANTINGGAGDDKITGGGGADILAGGSGADTFIYKALSDSAPATPDTITDFVHGTDLIDLSLLDSNTALSGNQAFLWGGQNANVVANSVTWHEDGVNTIVQADVNGNTAAAELAITLTGINLGLTDKDFIL